MLQMGLRLAILTPPDHLPATENSAVSSLGPSGLGLPHACPRKGPVLPRLRPAMRRLRIGIVDLVTKSPNPSLYGRVMNANLASIMPQVLAVWCEQEGHSVRFVCYTGMENLLEELPADLDLVFVRAFTQS